MKKHLIGHIDSVHLKITAVECPYCKKSFTREDSMRRHIKVKHPEKPVIHSKKPLKDDTDDSDWE